MTAKRFTFEIKTQGNKAYTQWYDNGKPINSAETLCELLNELHEENQRLRKEVQGFIKGIQDSSRMSAEAIVKGMGDYD